MNGKGDTYRPVDKKKFDENYDRIFGKKEVDKEEENSILEKLTKEAQELGFYKKED